MAQTPGKAPGVEGQTSHRTFTIQADDKLISIHIEKRQRGGFKWHMRFNWLPFHFSMDV